MTRLHGNDLKSLANEIVIEPPGYISVNTTSTSHGKNPVISCLCKHLNNPASVNMQDGMGIYLLTWRSHK